MASNLPPGCTVGDIERAMGGDSRMEAAEEWAIEELDKHCKTPDEYRFAVLAGIAAVEALRGPVQQIVNDRVADALAADAEVRAAHDYRARMETGAGK